ncbi:hypothetical protein Acsp03_33740 [Actinomadura sp. NBRC 104412]|nr:hypothetical protein Acsp03_33740 [Actinomadura sp. NBRC 104412]
MPDAGRRIWLGHTRAGWVEAIQRGRRAGAYRLALIGWRVRNRVSSGGCRLAKGIS